jgi:phosphate transport system substrate-binding protein
MRAPLLRTTLVAFLGSFLAATATAQNVAIDPKIPEYSPAQGISGTIKSVGSDTLNNVLTHAAEAFQKAYPGVKVEVEGKGSSTAPPALIEGTSQFGPMSREMKGEEIDKFEKKYGYKPMRVRLAVDALAVFVHRDNPLTELSFEQLQKTFSVKGPDLTWGDLGAKDPAFKDQRVVLYGRNSSSGTYGFFKEHALGKADFKSTVKEQPGSSAVVQAVGQDKFAMGYSGIGYKTADVKMLKISNGGPASEPTYANALSGDYPLARFLYVYLNKDPNKELDPLRGEFVRFMLSKQGQEAVVKDGYFPVPAEAALEDLKACKLAK